MCPVSLQDCSCRTQYCEEAFRCWNGWITYCCWPAENRDECHEHKGTCFPSTAKLRLQDGRSVAMSELQVGDRVQTGLL